MTVMMHRDQLFLQGIMHNYSKGLDLLIMMPKLNVTMQLQLDHCLTR